MKPEFYGREAELSALHECHRRTERGIPQLVVLFGRRRVGKTFLLQQFLSELSPRTGVYHACSYLSLEEELRAISRSLAGKARLPSDEPSLARPGDLDAFFELLEHSATDEPLVVVIDEVPYLIQGTERFPAALQRFWDRLLTSGATNHLMIVLTGSAISTMTTVVSSGGPLFGRPSRLLRLDPFDLPTAAAFLGIDRDSPTTQHEAVVEARAACGGYPLLLREWDVTVRATANLMRLAAEPLAPLVAMSSVLLLDLPEARGIRAALSAIGRGAHKHSEIQNLANLRIDAALHTLQDGGFVRPQVSIDEKATKAAAKKLYLIADEHLAFYFAMIDPYRQLFEAGQGQSVLRSSVSRWNTLLAATFENEARVHAVRLVDSGVIEEGTLIGEWWTARPAQAQIDVVGIDGQSGTWRLVGEVKWTNRFGNRELRQFEANLAIAGARAAAASKAIWVRNRGSVAIPAGHDLKVFDCSDLL